MVWRKLQDFQLPGHLFAEVSVVADAVRAQLHPQLPHDRQGFMMSYDDAGPDTIYLHLGGYAETREERVWLRLGRQYAQNADGGAQVKPLGREDGYDPVDLPPPQLDALVRALDHLEATLGGEHMNNDQGLHAALVLGFGNALHNNNNGGGGGGMLGLPWPAPWAHALALQQIAGANDADAEEEEEEGDDQGMGNGEHSESDGDNDDDGMDEGVGPDGIALLLGGGAAEEHEQEGEEAMVQEGEEADDAEEGEEGPGMGLNWFALPPPDPNNAL